MHYLGRFHPKVIGVTGSVGKTSTKEAIYTFLKRDFDVRKSEKSFNSEIGVPLAILGLKNAWWNPLHWSWNLLKGFWIAFFSRKYPQILILEIGADRPRDIKNTVSWLTPDIAVLTALAPVPVHVENFPDPAAVYKEKSELIKALKKEGTAVLNQDDERVMAMQKITPAKIITFGMKDLSEISVSGLQNPYPILAAAAVARVLGMNDADIKEISAKITATAGRMRELPGINGSLIIDDTYNSSPVAVESALNTLKTVQNKGKKIVALADMAELGRFSEAEHRRIGKFLVDIADSLVVVGEKAKWIFEESKSSRTETSRLRNFKVSPDATEAGIYLKNIIQEGDVILVKGSQSMRMEKLVEKIILDPEKNSHLLVRQEKEWKKI